MVFFLDTAGKASDVSEAPLMQKGEISIKIRVVFETSLTPYQGSFRQRGNK
jgi:hypothetical protein